MEKGKGVAYRTVIPLSALDINRDGLTELGIPERTLCRAMNEMWLEQQSPTFLHHVLIEVKSKHLVWGTLHRLTDDIPIRSLAMALYKSHTERMDEKYKELLEIAKNIPIELTVTDDSIAGWFIGQKRIQQKHKDKKFEQDTVLATGDWPPFGSVFVC